MAINKSIPTDFGIDAAYWNIGAVLEDFKGRGTEVTMYGYVDLAARLTGKQPLAVAKVNFIGPQYAPGADRSELYILIKADPAFIGAEDA